MHYQFQATIVEIYGLGCIDEKFIDNQLKKETKKGFSRIITVRALGLLLVMPGSNMKRRMMYSLIFMLKSIWMQSQYIRVLQLAYFLHLIGNLEIMDLKVVCA